ncbi:MAG: DUF2800 domain-containing protein [Evtepia gabavorous]
MACRPSPSSSRTSTVSLPLNCGRWAHSSKEVPYASRKHALLSASSASRWLKCTAFAEEHLPERTSEYAEEGRLAHAICELKTLKKFTVMTSPTPPASTSSKGRSTLRRWTRPVTSTLST